MLWRFARRIQRGIRMVIIAGIGLAAFPLLSIGKEGFTATLYFSSAAFWWGSIAAALGGLIYWLAGLIYKRCPACGEYGVLEIENRFDETKNAYSRREMGQGKQITIVSGIEHTWLACSSCGHRLDRPLSWSRRG